MSEDWSAESYFSSLEEERAVSAEELQALRGEYRSKSGAATSASVPAESTEESVRDARAELKDMTLPLRIKAAMFGDAIIRSILITDSNQLIQNAVLNNPQLRDTEIEAFSKNRNVDQNVLRMISRNRTWMKSYSIKIALVFNPKSPQDVALKWLRFLTKNDVRKLARSKNVPGAVNVAARKRLSDMEKR